MDGYSVWQNGEQDNMLVRKVFLRTWDLITLNFLLQAMSEKIPAVPKALDARRKQRDDYLTGLAKLKKEMKSDLV